MTKPGHTGFIRIHKAFMNSWNGLLAAFKNEAAVRQELALIMIAIPLAIYFGHNNIDRCLLFITPLLVLLTELLNSAIEATLDRISTEHHELIGYAKDAGSAAVMIALFIMGITWGMVIFS